MKKKKFVKQSNSKLKKFQLNKMVISNLDTKKVKGGGRTTTYQGTFMCPSAGIIC